MFGHESQKEQRKEVFELIRQGLLILKDKEKNQQFNNEELEKLINIINLLEFKKNKDIFYRVLKRLKKKKDYEEFKKTLTAQIISLKNEKKEEKKRAIQLSIQGICLAVLLSIFSACGTAIQTQESHFERNQISQQQKADEIITDGKIAVQNLSNYLADYINSFSHNKNRIEHFNRNLEIMREEISKQNYLLNEFYQEIFRDMIFNLENSNKELEFALFNSSKGGLFSSRNSQKMYDNYVYIPLILLKFFTEVNRENNLAEDKVVSIFIKYCNVFKCMWLVDAQKWNLLGENSQSNLPNINFKLSGHLIYRVFGKIIDLIEHQEKTTNREAVQKMVDFFDILLFIDNYFYTNRYIENPKISDFFTNINFNMDATIWRFFSDSRPEKNLKKYEKDLDKIFKETKLLGKNVEYLTLLSLALNVKKVRSIESLTSLIEHNNIVNFQRFSEETLKRLQQENNPNKKNCLIIIARQDWNRIFDRVNYRLNKLVDFDRTINKFFPRSRFNLNLFEVENEAQVNIFLQNHLRFADVLIFAGHGTEEGISLGDKTELDPLEIPQENRKDKLYLDISDTNILKNVRSTMKDEGTIIFYSCSVGKNREEGLNFVEAMRESVSNQEIKIFGAEEPITHLKPIFDDKGNVQNVIFYNRSKEIPSYEMRRE